MSRPTSFNADLGDLICAELAEGKSLRSICKEEAMPSVSSVCLWIAKGDRGVEEYKEFSEQYARAREAQSHALVDEVIDIADDKSRDVIADEDGNEHANSEFIARSRVRIDTRFKVAARMNRQKFGEKTHHELTGKDGKDLVPAPQLPITTDLVKDIVKQIRDDF